MNTVNKIKAELQKLTGKQHVALLPDGKRALFAVLQHLKSGRSSLLIQDQGGMLSYKQIARKECLPVFELKTDYGLVDIADLIKKASPASALLVNSLSGFFAEQDMPAISAACSSKQCLLVNDVSGTIGSELAKIGDIIIGSFGRYKPVNIKYGAFVASDVDFASEFQEDYAEQLYARLCDLSVRLAFLHNISRNIKKELASTHNVLHVQRNGINVVVEYRSEDEKKQLVEYCERNTYPYLLCPRYSRVNENAVSIEVKQLVRT